MPALVFLEGPLGAGKTALVRGFLRELGVSGAVRSPTYTLVEPYATPEVRAYHFDLYRITDPEELEYIGASEYLAEHAVCLVEWPSRAAAALPPPDLTVGLHVLPEGRRAVLESGGRRGDAWVRDLAGSM